VTVTENLAVTPNAPPGASNRCKYAQLQLFDDAGNSTTPIQTKIELDDTPPDAPRIANSATTVDRASITIALAVNAQDVHLAGYQLKNGSANFASLAPTPDNTCLTASPPQLCQFNVPLNANQENRIEIRAVDVAGNVSASDFVAITEDSIAPSRPAGLTVVAGDRQLALSWNPNGEADLGGYRVYYGTAVGPTCSTTIDATYNGVFATQGQSPIEVGFNLDELLTDLPNGEDLCVAVTAIDLTQPQPHESAPAVARATPFELAPNLVATINSTQLGINATDFIGAVAERDGLLYVAAKNRGLMELDASNEACFALTTAASFASCTGLVTSTATLTDPRDVLLHGGFAFVADSTGTHVFKLGAGIAPLQVFNLTTANDTGALQVAANGNVLAVARGTSGASIYDLSPLYSATPAAPTFVTVLAPVVSVGTIGNAQPIDSVEIEGNNLYLPQRKFTDTAGDEGNMTPVFVIPSTFPSGPITNEVASDALPTEFAGGNQINVMRVAGSHAFSTTTGFEQELTIWNITPGAISGGGNPHCCYQSPTQIPVQGVWRIAVAGPHVYVAGAGTLNIFDISSRDNARFLGRFGSENGALQQRGSLAVDGHRLFFGDGNSANLAVLHTGEPRAAELVTETNLTGRAEGKLLDDQVPNSCIDELHLERDTEDVLGDSIAVGVVEGEDIENHRLVMTQGGAAPAFQNLFQGVRGRTDLIASSAALSLSSTVEGRGALLRWPYALALQRIIGAGTDNAQARSFKMAQNPAAAPALTSSPTFVTGLVPDQGSYGGLDKVAVYGGFVYVALENLASTNPSEGIWRVAYDPSSGALTSATQVLALGNLEGIAVYGRRLFAWEHQGRLLAFPITASTGALGTQVVLSANASANQVRPVFAAGSLYVPVQNLGITEALTLTFDPSSFALTGATHVFDVDGSTPRFVVAAGDRFYVYQAGSNTQIFRLR
jgi:hypothetical protein